MTSRPIVVVTGAEGGIGRAAANHMADIRSAAGDSKFTVVRADLGEVAGPQTHPLDVTDSAACSALFEDIARLGPLRAVVHTAGTLISGPAMSADPAEIERVIRVNLLGTAHVLTAAARVMVAQDPVGADRARCLLTVASNSARRPRSGLAAYSATKAAASQFTRSLGLELGDNGIRCMVVSPGTTDTPMLRAMWEGEDHRDQTVAGNLATYQPGIPLQRIAAPEDIAPLIGFLLSEGAAHMTLGDIAVDGGASQS
ncbi:SDR family oxidoreductase [Kocuria sp.]|uniref:SDR family oxidoreductase n=1 Tax=Kocuria sp. TaxID=1871328 RepID=UPI0026E06495|nr:SDR family oxidoreductase [Kocuria sp.]MDO5618428.1 SDR family oxidoreductase [Kocuria sp.]